MPTTRICVDFFPICDIFLFSNECPELLSYAVLFWPMRLPSQAKKNRDNKKRKPDYRPWEEDELDEDGMVRSFSSFFS